MSDRFRIAIVSDLHVFSRKDAGSVRPSWLDTASSQSASTSNPLSDLKRLIVKDGLSADLLIVPGDIADKADPAGLAFGWRAVHDIKSWLGSKSLTVTVGNHDLDSRGLIEVSDEIDPKGNLQNLDPPFPCIDREMRNRYWAENFNVMRFGDVRVVNLNTCAYHGYISQQKTEAEHNHGRVSDSTISRLKEELTNDGDAIANLLVMHHHPFANREFKFLDREAVQNGEALIRLLSESGDGNWLIIHGHRHAPNIIQCPGTGASPYAFSAGSFSVQIDRTQLINCDNQFYIVELNLQHARNQGGGVYGIIQSWTWTTGEGWAPTAWDARVPMGAGFGKRLQPHEIVRTILAAISSGGPETYRTLEEVSNTHPELRFVLHSDLKKSLDLIERKEQANVTRSTNFWKTEIFPKEV